MDTFEENVDDPIPTFNDSDLVDAVAQYPALYDIKLAQYHNTSIKSRCWELVSQTVNHPVDICMSRWIRLKDNFRREKNKRELESRSGQGLSNRKGFALYSSMGFMHAHMKKRQSFTNVKSSQQNVAAKKAYPGPPFTGSTAEEQFQYIVPRNTQVGLTSAAAMQDRPYTVPQRVQNTPANTYWDHGLQPQTTNYLESIPTQLPIHNRNTPVWISPTETVAQLFPTVSQSPVTVSTPPVMINTNPTTDNRPVQTFEAVNVTESAITFATPAVPTESTIGSTAPTTLTEFQVIPITSTSAVEPIVTSSSITPTEVSATTELLIPPSPSVRARTPLTKMSSPNVRVPQCSPNTMWTPFNFYNPASPSTSTSSSPAPPSPADSVYSSVYSDVSCDDNVDDVDTIQTRSPTAQRYTAMKSASTLTSTSVTLSQKNSPAAPKGCYTKDSMRPKKLDPLEACMISLSNSIKDKLEAEPASKQTIRTPDQAFGDMIAMELSRMDADTKAFTKSLITDILFAKNK